MRVSEAAACPVLREITCRLQKPQRSGAIVKSGLLRARMPSSRARRRARVRVLTLSLPKILARCFLVVPSEMVRVSQICWLVQPAATSCRTSSSRSAQGFDEFGGLFLRRRGRFGGYSGWRQRGEQEFKVRAQILRRGVRRGASLGKKRSQQLAHRLALVHKGANVFLGLCERQGVRQRGMGAGAVKRLKCQREQDQEVDCAFGLSGRF